MRSLSQSLCVNGPNRSVYSKGYIRGCLCSIAIGFLASATGVLVWMFWICGLGDTMVWLTVLKILTFTLLVIGSMFFLAHLVCQPKSSIQSCFVRLRPSCVILAHYSCAKYVPKCQMSSGTYGPIFNKN